MIEDHCEVREIMGTVDYMRKFFFLNPMSIFILLFYSCFFVVVCILNLAPEILQYEPISLASDLWYV